MKYFIKEKEWKENICIKNGILLNAFLVKSDILEGSSLGMINSHLPSCLSFTLFLFLSG